MARDYKQGSRHYSRGKSTGSGWTWLVLAILIAILVAGLLYLKQHQTVSNKKSKLHKQELNKTNAVKKKSNTANSTQPQFDFYTILPKAKVETNTPPAATVNSLTALPSPKVTTSESANNTIKKAAPIVSALPAPTTAAVMARAATATTAAATKYILQIAAVKDYADADRLKAELVMLGYDVSIQKITMNKAVLNRVYVGPYNSREVAQTQQKKLQANNISSVLLKAS